MCRAQRRRVGDLLPLLLSYGRRDLERAFDLPGNVPSGTERDFVCVYRGQVACPEVEDQGKQLGAGKPLRTADSHPLPHPRLWADVLSGGNDDSGRRRAVYERGNRKPSQCADRTDEIHIL